VKPKHGVPFWRLIKSIFFLCLALAPGPFALASDLSGSRSLLEVADCLGKAWNSALAGNTFSSISEIAQAHEDALVNADVQTSLSEVLELTSPLSESRNRELQSLAQRVPQFDFDIRKVPQEVHGGTERDHYFISLTKRFGLDPGAILSAYYKLGLEGKANVPDACIMALEKRKAQLNQFVSSVRVTASTLDIPVESHAIQTLVEKLVQQDRPGMDFTKVLAQTIRQVKLDSSPSQKSWDTFGPRFLMQFIDAAKPDSPLTSQTLEASSFSYHSFPAFPADSSFHLSPTDDEAIGLKVDQMTEQEGLSGHTLQTQDYIYRHLSHPIAQWLVAHPEVKIEIHTDPVSSGLNHLMGAGFKQVVRLKPNKMTDFESYLIQNPKTGEIRFLTFALPGRAYPIEIAAHFRMLRVGGKEISADRIQFYHSNDSAESQFKNIFLKYKVDPDLVMIGNTEKLRLALADQGVKPVTRILESGLSAYEYEVNGKRILSASIEPYLYADRTASFLKAAVALSVKRHDVFFYGTSGSMKSELRVHDWVIPTQFSDVNSDKTSEPTLLNNKARDLLPQLGLAIGPGIHPDGRVGSVDTILIENKKWLNQHRSGPVPIDVVEQETADLAQVIAHEQSKPEQATAPLSFYGILEVFDELAAEKDFNRNHFNLAPPRSGISAKDASIAFLKQVLGEKWSTSTTPNPMVIASTLQLNQTAPDQFLFRFKSPESGPTEVSLGIENLDFIRAVDPVSARVFEAELKTILYTAQFTAEGKMSDSKKVSESISDLIAHFQRDFGYSVKIDKIKTSSASTD